MQARQFDIGALQIGLRAAHFRLPEGIGIATDFGHARAGGRDFAAAPGDGAAGDFLDPDAAAHVAVAGGIGDVVRRNLERAARRASTARTDGEKIGRHYTLPLKSVVLRDEPRELPLDRIREAQLAGFRRDVRKGLIAHFGKGIVAAFE